MKEVITQNSEETEKVGFSFAKELHGGDVITLTGDLGFGKTTFVKGLAKGLGVNHRIISPTFILVRKYELKTKNKNSGIGTLYHVDLYRLEGKSNIESLGLEEIFTDKQAVIMIEWPERMVNLLPKKKYEIKFEYIDENKRKIIISL